MSGEIVANRNDEKQVIALSDEGASTQDLSEAEAELLARVEQQSRTVTEAEHKAIYGSMGRDIKGWLDRVNQPKAS